MTMQIESSSAGATEVLQSFIENKSYTIGIPKGTSTIQNPVFFPKFSATFLGLNLKKSGIKTIADLIANKKLPNGLFLEPHRTYQVYEVQDNGLLKFWGKFTPGNPVQPKSKKGLGDFVQQQPAQVQYQEPVLPTYHQTTNDIQLNRTNKQIVDSYEAQLKIVTDQLANINSIRDKEIDRLQQSHRDEISRLQQVQENEILSRDTRIGSLQTEIDNLKEDISKAHNEYIAVSIRADKLENEKNADRAEHKEKIKMLEDKHEIQKSLLSDQIEMRIRKANGGKNGMNDEMGGFWDVLKLFSPEIKSFFGGDKQLPSGNTPSGPRPIVNNPGQNLADGAGSPPPARRRIPLEEDANPSMEVKQ